MAVPASEWTMPGVGVDLGDEAETVRQYRIEHGDEDILNRSQAVRELIAMGGAADEALREADWSFDSPRSRRLWIKQAIRDAVDRERDG
jgi:hypothetical protein